MTSAKRHTIVVISILALCFFLASVGVLLGEIKHHGLREVLEHIFKGDHIKDFHSDDNTK